MRRDHDYGPRAKAYHYARCRTVLPQLPVPDAAQLLQKPVLRPRALAVKPDGKATN